MTNRSESVSNIVNLADHRKFVQKDPDDPEASVIETLPPAMQKGVADFQLRLARAASDYERLKELAETFQPSTVPALENPALAPLWSLRFNNAKLFDTFYPPRDKLQASEYERLYDRFGVNYYPRTDGDHITLWILVGKQVEGVGRLRAAYEKAGLPFIDSIVSAASHLSLDEKQPGVMLLLPRQDGGRTHGSQQY